MSAITLDNLLSPTSCKRVCAELASSLRGTFELVEENAAELGLPTFRHIITGVPFKLIPGGRFLMGLGEQEELAARRIRDPIPANLEEMRPAVNAQVEAFMMSALPITARVFEKVSGKSPAELDVLTRPAREIALAELALYYPPEQPADHPAFVKFGRADDFAKAVACSVPTEVQWEYACRATTQTPFVWGNEVPPDAELDKWLSLDFAEGYEIRNRCNGFGLYGLFTGEWCQDHYRASHDPAAPVRPAEHVVRGGGAMFWPWQDQEWVWCMSAMRMPESGLFVDRRAGFRLIRTIVS